MATTGQRIKLLRSEKKLSQERLAELLNISRGSLSSYELDVSEPPDQTKKGLASFFGVSLDYLCGYSDFRTNTFVSPLNENDYLTVPIFENLLYDKKTINKKLAIPIDKAKDGTYFFTYAPEDFDIVRIRKNDLLLIKEEIILADELLVLIEMNKFLFIKKLLPYGSDYILFNSSHQPNFITVRKENVKILGEIKEVSFTT